MPQPKKTIRLFGQPRRQAGGQGKQESKKKSLFLKKLRGILFNVKYQITNVKSISKIKYQKSKLQFKIQNLLKIKKLEYYYIPLIRGIKGVIKKRNTTPLTPCLRRQALVPAFCGAGKWAKKYSHPLIASILLIVLITSFFFIKTKAPSIFAATYYFIQNSWSGGASTTALAIHPTDSTGWTKYQSASSTIIAGANITASTTSGNWPDNFSGVTPDSNTYVSGGLINLKKNNGVSCTTAGTTNYECTSDNCDADFSSGNYCHATATSCVDFAKGGDWEQVTGYKKCSANTYYKQCSESTAGLWGSQVNSPDTAVTTCSGQGDAAGGYDPIAVCTSGPSFSWTDPGCTTCTGGYKGDTSNQSCTTNCCYANCATNDDTKCVTGYHCYSGDSACYTNALGSKCDVDAECASGYYCNTTSHVCADPWISGYCGVQVYYADVSGTKQWKTSNTNCDTPQCGIDGGQDGDNLVASNTVDFSLYTARNECKTLGGRLPTKTELLCIYTNRASLGSFQSTWYRSSTEYNTNDAWIVDLGGGGTTNYTKTNTYYVRCVR